MRINQTLIYPITPENLVAILSSEEFIMARFTKMGLTPKISISETPLNTFSSPQEPAHTVRTALSIPATILPPQVRSFVPATIQAALVETFTPAGEEWHVNTALELESLPISAHGTSILRSVTDGTERVVEGEIHVKIPFIGRKVEEQLGQHLDEAADAEVQAVRDWLNR